MCCNFRRREYAVKLLSMEFYVEYISRLIQDFDMEQIMGTTILSAVLASLVAIVLTIVIEKLHKPRLKLEIVSPVDRLFDDRPAHQMRAVRVRLSNSALPRWASWMLRNAALQCHGTITFYHLDGQNVFGRSMHIRWSDAPEPIPIRVQIGNHKGLIFDPTRFTITQRVDIYPGESAELDVAVRFDNEPECYGWSNESYFSDPPWRNPNWKLPPERYLVGVNILSSGERCTSIFRLINNVTQPDFRLEAPMPSDVVRE